MSQFPPTAIAATAQLDRIEAKLDRLLSGPPPEIIGLKEAMTLTGCRSVPAFYRASKLLGFRSYLKGKYRYAEVKNAVARKSLEDRLAESQAEARGPSPSRINPHD